MLLVQDPGELRRDLHRCTWWAVRLVGGAPAREGTPREICNKIMISD